MIMLLVRHLHKDLFHGRHCITFARDAIIEIFNGVIVFINACAGSPIEVGTSVSPDAPLAVPGVQ